jgi:predicted nucleic acid-binding protein
MPTYFDASVVVSLVKKNPGSARAASLWLAEPQRVSSTLLAVECLTAIRRGGEAGWTPARDAEPRLELILGDVTLKQVDEDVVEIVRRTPALARCRALDVVHLATALHFADRSDEPFALATFDARMAEVAAAVGLKVVGPAVAG